MCYSQAGLSPSVDEIGSRQSGNRAGVATVNPKAKVLRQYAESFVDDAKGEQIATTMISQKADVIYHASGNVGVGVARVCAAKKVWFIGVDKDQSALTPDYTLTSMLKGVCQTVYDVTKNWADGKFDAGKTLVLGLKEGGVGYASFTKISADVKTKVDEYSAKIVAGTLVVPSTNADADTYMAALPK